MTLSKKTLPSLFWNKVHKHPRNKAIGWIEEDTIKYYRNSDYKDVIESLTLGLKEVGCIKNDKVAILSTTCKEWHLTDLAILCSGATVVPIYPTYLAEEVEYILNHSEATILVVEDNDQLSKFIEVQNKLPNVKTIISFQSLDTSLTDSLKIGIEHFEFNRLKELGNKLKEKSESSFKLMLDEIDEEAIASIIYTSGTTGEPKGTIIKQKAFYQMLKNVAHSLGNNIDHNDKALTFLPLSHVLGRCDSMLNLTLGLENIYGRSIDKIIDDLAIVKPTIMIAVPRIFEKVHAKILDTIENSGPLKKKIFNWAQDVSNEYFEAIDQDKSPSSKQILERNLAYKLVYKKYTIALVEKFAFRIRWSTTITWDYEVFKKCESINS